MPSGVKRSKKQDVKSIREMTNNLFEYDSKEDDFTNFPVDALESQEISAQKLGHGFEDNDTITFPLNPNCTYLIDSSCKFEIAMHLEKSVFSNNSWGEYIPAISADLNNLTFYSNFVRKKFIFELYLKNQKVEVNHSFDDITSGFEAYLYSLMHEEQKDYLFGGLVGDTSLFNFSKSSNYKLSHLPYKSYLSGLVGLSTSNYFFSPFLSLPYPNLVNSDNISFKPVILPEVDYGNGYNFTLKIKESDVSCFYQNETSTKNKIRYRLKITDMKLYVNRLRYFQSGYSMKRHVILNALKNKIPAFVTETYVASMSAGDAFVSKNFYNFRTPSHIIIFKTKDSAIRGLSEKISYRDIDTWEPLNIDKVSVLANGLKLFDSAINSTDQTHFYSKFLNLWKNKRSFCNFRLDPTLTADFISSADYHFKSLHLNFLVTDGIHLDQFVNPILSNNRKMLQDDVDLSIRLDFDTSSIQTAGLLVFFCLYDKHHYSFSDSGFIKSPLLH